MYSSFSVYDIDSKEERIFSTEIETIKCIADYLRIAAEEMERGTFDGLHLEIWENEQDLLNEIII